MTMVTPYEGTPWCLFEKKMSNVFNWHYIDENSRLNNEGCNSRLSLHDKKRTDVKAILKSILRENTNKLFFGHTNINSLRNKFWTTGGSS